MRFSGFILALFHPIKPVSPAAADKAYSSLQCWCTSIYSGAFAFA